MTLRCVKKTIKDLLPLFLSKLPENMRDDDDFVSTTGYFVSGSNLEHYDVVIDSTYEVFGIMIFENIVRYLLVIEGEPPQWHPSELFEIIDTTIPYHWHANTFTSIGRRGFLIGYESLVEDYEHLVELIDKKPRALEIFFEEKAYVDNLK